MSQIQSQARSKVRVAGFSLSIDGFSAGPDQTLSDPLGKNGTELFQWFFPTRTFRAMTGHPNLETGPLDETKDETSPDANPDANPDIDDRFAAQSMANFGAFILGRNMFGPVRGPWPNDVWKGWWGDNPPYHAPTYILTHHAHDPIVMEGGTVFHFVTGGIHQALAQARDAAGDKDIKIGGGASVVRQYLAAGLVDTIHLAISPTVLGQGESPLTSLNLRELGYKVTSHTGTEKAMHVVLERDEGGCQDDN